jgi:hypothetical protein
VVNFSDSLDDDTTLFRVTNNAITVLASGVSPTDTELLVFDNSLFPDFGIVSIDAELILYSGTSVVPDKFINVVRGFSGTSAVSHSLGEEVELRVIAEHHNSLKDAVLAVEQYLGTSNSPASGTITFRLNSLTTTVSGVADTIILGPDSSTDEAIVRWDGITGKLVQNSKVLIDDFGSITTSGSISIGSGPLEINGTTGEMLFPGPLTISGTQINLLEEVTIGNGTFSIDGDTGTISYPGQVTITGTSVRLLDSAVVGAGTFSIDGDSGLISYPGDITISGSDTVNIKTNLDVSGVASFGTGTIVVDGTLNNILSNSVLTVSGTLVRIFDSLSVGNSTFSIDGDTGLISYPGNITISGSTITLFDDVVVNGLLTVDGEDVDTRLTLLEARVTALEDFVSVTTITVSGNHSVTNEDLVLVDAASSPVVISLPVASGTYKNQIYNIKKTDSTGNFVTVSGIQNLIDGESVQIMSNQYDSIQLVSDTNNWWII